MDLKMHEANKQSGLLPLLESYGIPCYNPSEKMTEDGKIPNVIASHVQHADLEKHYNWGFYNTIYNPKANLKSLFQNTLAFRLTCDPEEIKHKLLKLPHDWESPQGNDIQSLTRKTLALQFKAGIKNLFVWPAQEYCSREDVEAIEYPEPKVTLYEMDKCHSEPFLGIEWTMLKIVEFPGLSRCGSEMDLQRHIGSTLAGFFNIVECTILSNTDVTFPTAISCFGSFCRADFASRLNISAIESNKMLPSSFRPIVLAGEAKNKLLLNADEEELPDRDAETHELAAQLACVVQPTLVLMIIDAICRWEAARRINPETRFLLPEYAFMHGIAYDASGVLIYGFFPRVVRFSHDGTPCVWGFGCTVVSTGFTQVFKHPRCHTRLELVKVLLVIQHHATHLSHKLRNLSLCDEFVKCDKLWKDWGLMANAQ